MLGETQRDDNSLTNDDSPFGTGSWGNTPVRQALSPSWSSAGGLAQGANAAHTPPKDDCVADHAQMSQQDLDRVNRCISMSNKINRLIRTHSCESSSSSSIVLVSLPPPPEDHPSLNYMAYLDAMIQDVSVPMLLVRGYRRAVLTLYT